MPHPVKFATGAESMRRDASSIGCDRFSLGEEARSSTAMSFGK